MENDRSTERTAILATYSSRLDAERAQERLEDAGIQAFISADDAGGMHPELQRTQGVELRVMSSRLQEADEILREEAFLPSDTPRKQGQGPGEEPASQTNRGPLLAALVLVAAIIAIAVLLLL